MDFKDLHNQKYPLLLGNVWDVQSAMIAEKLNFQAIGTSSSAMATLLGYPDGEKMSFSELEYLVKKIVNNTTLPLSVDLEAGYSRTPAKIADHIKLLVDLGVAGINIEDSLVDNSRKMQNPDEFVQTLSAVIEILHKANINIFINVRTDTFLLNHPHAIEETIRRILLYQSAGADGIFTPCIERSSDIAEIVNCTRLPINVMCMPNLPDFETLATLGVKRISMGNVLFEKMYHHLEKMTQTIVSQKSFKSIR